MNSHTSQQRLLEKVLLALLVVTAAVFLKPGISGAKDPAKERNNKVAPAKSPDATTGDLKSRIDGIIDQSDLAYARWGVCVMSLKDGSVVYERDAKKLFTPASNMKIYTTAVALDLLGAGYRWRTSVYSSVPPDSSGQIHGDLVLYGRGSPDLVSLSKDGKKPSLSALADQLYQKGVRIIEGNVIGDESYFRGDALGDGWQWTDLQWYFGAEASALSINGNEVDVNIVPGSGSSSPEVKVSNAQANLVVANRMGPLEKESRPTVGLHRGLSDNNLEVWGEFAPSSKGFGARLAVHDPAAWAARLFVESLKARGIVVKGQAQSRNSHTAPSARFDPAKSSELGVVYSQPLNEIVRETNKESINLNAELILRTLGRERGTLVAGPAPAGRESGDDETGLAVMRAWLARAGVPLEHVALHDGSGLSRLDLVTPQTSAYLLKAVANTAAGNAFKESLPIAGRDGTLGGRLKGAADRVWAKTGSLTYDNSLAGYFVNARGETFAFAIMCNDQTGHDNSTRVIDQIVMALAGEGNSTGENQPKSQ